MTETVRLPDPVYDRAAAQAEREDVPIGAVVREWMHKADKYDELEGRQR